MAEPIITQLCMDDYPMQNFTTIRSEVFDSHLGEIVFTLLLFTFVGFSNSLPPKLLHRF